MALSVASQHTVAIRPLEGAVTVKMLPLVQVTFDSSYPTGGETLTASTLGLSSILNVVIGGTSAGGFMAVWDPVNGKILLFDAAFAQAANASDQSSIVVYCTVYGT